MVYFDNAATTPVPKAVADAMYEVLTAHFGNPSSQYPIGVEMKKAVEGWRAVIAGALGCPAERLYFTSCGTESDNWAIQAALWQNRHRGRHIITTAVEHSAVLEPCKLLAQQGYEVTYLKPGRDGNVTAEQVADALREDTALVSVMLVNNETGCVFPAADIAALLREKGSPALLHCDAVQGFLKVPCEPEVWGVDMMSLSAHKLGGPKGVGALYISERFRNVRPLLPGGGQERGLRSGTEATPQIAALAAAAKLGKDALDEHIAYLNDLKAYALAQFQAFVPGLVVVSAGDAPHICAVSLPGYPSQVVVRYLSDQGFCLSAGSACHRGKASHVYAAMNLSKPVRDGMLRVSFGPSNTKEEVDQLAQALLGVTKALVAAGR